MPDSHDLELDVLLAHLLLDHVDVLALEGREAVGDEIDGARPRILRRRVEAAAVLVGKRVDRGDERAQS